MQQRGHASTGRFVEHEVGTPFERFDRVGDRNAELTGGKEVVVVLGVTYADGAVP